MMAAPWDKSPLYDSVEIVRAPTGCDGCSVPAINMVSNDDHRYHSFRCAPCTTKVVANFALIGAVMRVEPLRRSVQ